ncbi:MAG: 4-alpha-glucanotransferase [Ktedonobacterales bacterium]
MKLLRGNGIIVHPTSFPSPFGIGDLGTGAISILDYLAASKQRYWQVLPLHPTGYGNSPYATLSAFAGNPLMISLERLQERGLLLPSELADHPEFPEQRVDYGEVISWKVEILERSFERFVANGQRFCKLQHELEGFCQEQQDWLDDYALFAALKAVHHGVAWTRWAADLAARDPQALAEARRALAGQIAFHQYLQFWFFSQWAELRRAAHERQIAIIGDVPIFVAHDSADVWARRELFQLDREGHPLVVAGVPPDYFSASGQRWGNPVYRWELMRETGYAWWVARVRHLLELVDVIRLDHFRGFHKYWEIPAQEAVAVHGQWVRGPGDSLFIAIRKRLGDVNFLAEDLGYITTGVTALRERLGFPGMRVLQFAFGGDAGNQHLPHHYTQDVVVYTGTHDNDTTLGWFRSCSDHERRHVLRYLHASEAEAAGEIVRAAVASVAKISMLQLQDVLGLGSEARMNWPASICGNWEWRCTREQLTHPTSRHLADLCTLYGR